MAARSNAVARASELELFIERVLDAPRALVFEAWTDQARAAQWWGPQGFTTISCDMDVRPGGRYRASMRSPQGSIHTRQGVYREIVAPEKLVFTFAWEDETGTPGHEMVVTVRFAELGNKTRLTLHQSIFESIAARDSHFGGWTSCMQRFADYLAQA